MTKPQYEQLCAIRTRIDELEHSLYPLQTIQEAIRARQFRSVLQQLMTMEDDQSARIE